MAVACCLPSWSFAQRTWHHAGAMEPTEAEAIAVMRSALGVASGSEWRGIQLVGALLVDGEGNGRVVFGLSERRLKAITGDHADNPTLDLPCRTVFAAGQRSTEVLGPLLEDEAAALHAGAWDRGAP